MSNYTVYLVGLYKYGEPMELSTHPTKREAMSEFKKQSKKYTRPELEVCVYKDVDVEMIATTAKEDVKQF